MRARLSIVCFLWLALAACQDRTAPTQPLTSRPSFAQVPGGPVVNSLADPGDATCDDNECTLREAIAFASAGATITFSVTGTIDLTQIDVCDCTTSGLMLDKDLTITGPGASQLTVRRNAAAIDKFRILHVGLDVTAVISGLTLSEGRLPNEIGGGIYNAGTLTLSYVVVANNSILNTNAPRSGAGIYNGGTLTLDHSTVSGNTGGAGYEVHGAGIASTGQLFISHSTVANNHAPEDVGGILNNGQATIVNSTISGNSSLAHGGIRNGGQLTLSHTTVTNNSGPSGGGIRTFLPGSVVARNTIVANNTGGNCVGPITDDGFNLDDGTTCGFSGSSLSSTNPLLGVLAPNGASTMTHALAANSPAIDVGTCTDTDDNTVADDQRGVTRPQGSGCDIGAYEFDGFHFTGFFAPVNNPDTLNVVKAGSSVPLKFSLGGNFGLEIFAAGYPKVDVITCDSADPQDAITQTVTSGNSGLTYNAATGIYAYVWKTQKTWTGCRQVTMTFTDGSSHSANFQFIK